jgi:Dyp-type peroxidase family
MRDDGRKFAGLPSWLRETTTQDAGIARFHDVQANLLRPSFHSRVLHTFVRFGRDRQDEAKAWIQAFARQYLPSASDQLAGRAVAPWGNVSLSASFYQMLGLRPPEDRSFRDGMKRANLNDPPVTEWDAAFRADLDAMISLGGASTEHLERARRALAGLKPLAEVFHIEEGSELPGGVEHFGFVDGISQPVFVEEDLPAGENRTMATPLQVVLSPDPHGLNESSYGSYAVFRKLRQHVSRFEEGIGAMAHALGVSGEMAGAMVIGRFKDGTPLMEALEAGPGPTNGFTYEADRGGVRCPFASHIRRSNPRGELDEVAHAPDWQARIARRGIPYGQPGDEEVGLLFLCYQSDVGAQFELIQNNWFNFPHFPVLHVGRDPIVGQQNSWDHFEGQAWPAGTGGAEVQRFGFPQCVDFRGGEYFFAPSLSFLRTLCNPL